MWIKATDLVLDTTSLHLVCKDLCPVLLGLGLVDVLHEDTLVLEDVTLGFLVERVVAEIDTISTKSLQNTAIYAQVLVDLAGLSVLPQQPSENPLATHPLNLAGHTSLSSTLSFTGAGVTTLALRREEIASAGARVDGGGLDDDTAVLNELLDMSAGVGVADFRLFIGVKPDFSLANALDGCGEPLLRAKVDHRCLSPPVVLIRWFLGAFWTMLKATLTLSLEDVGEGDWQRTVGSCEDVLT